MKNHKIFTCGFTLAELMIVVSIITALVIAGMNYYVNSLQKARDTERRSDIVQIGLALEMYRRTEGRYPPDLPTLSAGYISDPRVFEDPYESPNYHYEPNFINISRYQLGARLEGGNPDQTTNCSLLGIGLDCGAGPNSCNYCITGQ